MNNIGTIIKSHKKALLNNGKQNPRQLQLPRQRVLPLARKMPSQKSCIRSDSRIPRRSKEINWSHGKSFQNQIHPTQIYLHPPKSIDQHTSQLLRVENSGAKLETSKRKDTLHLILFYILACSHFIE